MYVDKTAFVYRLVSEGKPYFLSRPRRFGKSLFLSTLRAYLEGKRSLFGGLAIERLEAEGAAEEGREPWVARPVFHLDFDSGYYTAAGELEKKLDATLRVWEDTWQAQRRDGTLGDRFLRTLQQAHAQSGHRVAVLVDEYDKPLLECMDNPALEERNRACLKGFYGALKPADEHLRFAFLTGVTKFSKVSIFSDLNQLRDVSMAAECAGHAESPSASCWTTSVLSWTEWPRR